MADDLAQLEKDVEATRARLSSHLATLRSPDTYSEFADGIKQTALDTKDSLVEQARTRTRSAIDEFVDSLKARAAMLIMPAIRNSRRLSVTGVSSRTALGILCEAHR